MNIVKLAGACIARSEYLTRALLSIGCESLRIVYYHMVAEQDHPYYFKSSAVSPEIFTKQLRFYKNHFEVISLEAALDRIAKGERLQKCLCITSDDGFSENHSLMAPILHDRDMPGTFFLTSNCLDNRMLMWRNILVYVMRIKGRDTARRIAVHVSKEESLRDPARNEDLLSWSMRCWTMGQKDRLAARIWELAELEPIQGFLEKRKPYMTTQQVRELIEAGFKIGSHSASHPDFGSLDYETAEHEITSSLKTLESLSGRTVDMFSYPFSRRASSEVEQRFIREHGNKCRTLLGIKSRLGNFSNPYKWERDKQEDEFNVSMLRFTVLPVARKYLPLSL